MTSVRVAIAVAAPNHVNSTKWMYPFAGLPPSIRRINELEEADLLELHDRPLSDEHRRVKVYRRKVDGVEVDFRDGLTVEVEERSAVKNRLDDVWRDLSSSK